MALIELYKQQLSITSLNNKRKKLNVLEFLLVSCVCCENQ